MSRRIVPATRTAERDRRRTIAGGNSCQPIGDARQGDVTGGMHTCGVGLRMAIRILRKKYEGRRIARCAEPAFLQTNRWGSAIASERTSFGPSDQIAIVIRVA